MVSDAKARGYYIAGVYREKASGARADRPELLRMISDLQSGEVVIAEKIDRISRLPLPEAEKLVQSIKETEALVWLSPAWGFNRAGGCIRWHCQGGAGGDEGNAAAACSPDGA